MLLSVAKIGGTLCLLAHLAASQYDSTTFPAAQSNLSSNAQFLSREGGLDAPKVIPVNSSTYGWWYFDAVSEDQSHSIIVTFFVAGATGFPLTAAPSTDILSVYLFVSTPTNPQQVIGPIFATDATVKSSGNGASGVWKGTGFSFTGHADLESYSVHIDAPHLGIVGEIFLKSLGPAHYPYGSVRSGSSMQIMPHIGWANAIPDAAGHVSVTINGTKVEFDGSGYHDKNWGDAPFDEAVASWFWGHARLGPYSIVWYSGLSPSGSETVSAYIARCGKILAAGCTLPIIKVRPSGQQDAYPPALSAGQPSGNFHIEIDLHDEGTMVVNVKPTYLVLNAEIYYRWAGQVTGGIKGEKVHRGTAMYEEFVLTG